MYLLANAMDGSQKVESFQRFATILGSLDPSDAQRRPVRDRPRGRRFGHYPSADKVVADALRLWDAQHNLLGFTPDEIRRAWQEGIDSGRAGPLDMEDIKRRARARLLAEPDEAEK
jgi:Arc/MetJ-type ribon-helix-helix transcriptional regulator